MQSNVLNRREFGLTLGGGLLAPALAKAQSVVPVIGFLRDTGAGSSGGRL
jgi:hypothetical protein